MSVIAEGGVDQAAVSPDSATAVPGGGSFLDRLVVRLAAEHDVDPRAVRALGAEALATFAGAPVQTFVPILVEKRLRASLRAQRCAGPDDAAAGPVRGGARTSAAAGRTRR